ncbi:hypothetical protein P872_15650 [Rhodonellum psychrophilum GCM71 = DSM 17998]|uniref:Uncharacterized protein n=1 Tax=Rhodonellum psychrophilum GCM71 = DSM 17998 TaxID=1123057 RepID=U5C5K7_9BACT|nr:hypothetical protein P872_15650 [Rhodonellum psychrophilum GCM71 = DSM 17998]
MFSDSLHRSLWILLFDLLDGKISFTILPSFCQFLYRNDPIGENNTK